MSPPARVLMLPVRGRRVLGRQWLLFSRPSAGDTGHGGAGGAISGGGMDLGVSSALYF